MLFCFIYGRGNETGLAQCDMPSSPNECYGGHDADVGVVCEPAPAVAQQPEGQQQHGSSSPPQHQALGILQQQQKEPAAEGTVRLVDGRGPWEGRLEVYTAGLWGTLSSNLLISYEDTFAKVRARVRQ